MSATRKGWGETKKSARWDCEAGKAGVQIEGGSKSVHIVWRIQSGHQEKNGPNRKKYCDQCPGEVVAFI